MISNVKGMEGGRCRTLPILRLMLCWQTMVILRRSFGTGSSTPSWGNRKQYFSGTVGGKALWCRHILILSCGGWMRRAEVNSSTGMTFGETLMAPGYSLSTGVRAGLGAELSVHDDEHRPLGRVVLLARGGNEGRGYAALCRAVSASHAHGRKPSISRQKLAELAALQTLTVLLGPLSDVGAALDQSDALDARARLTVWMRVLPVGL